MHSRFMKVIVLGAVLLAALPVAALAQTSRVGGMAIQGDYIKDYTAIYTYTNQVANVGNLVYGELGVATGGLPADRAVGAVMSDWWEGRYGSVGVHLRQLTPNLGQGDAQASTGPGIYGSDPNTNTAQQFDIMWGKKFGTSSLGLELHRSFGRLELDNDPLGFGTLGNLEFDFTQGNPNFARNVLGVGAGFGWEMSPSTNFEISAHWQTRTFEISDTNGVLLAQADGKTTFQLAARGWWQWQPNVMVVPVFKWYSYNLSTSAGTPAVVADNTLKGWQAGLAGNWTVGSNDLFVLGATFAQNKVEQEAAVFGVPTIAGTYFFTNGTITETFAPQLFAALEVHPMSWLTLRFGGNKGAWHSVEVNDKSSPANFTIHDSPFVMALGAGVKVGSLQIDGVMNNNLPHNGLYFVSGSSTSPMFTKVTATYPF